MESLLSRTAVVLLLLPLVCSALEGLNATLGGGAVVMGASHEANTVSFWGIRYATADRFQKPIVWTYPQDAVVDGRRADETTCWTPDNEGTEDCLFLDVSAPIGAEREPVMFWIHGGALISGSKNPYGEDMLNFVLDGGVVAVSVNYRLNILGFFTGSGPDAPPTNNGVRDQICALEWVRDNIDKFGGDATSVTIFGESAGGLSVTVLHQSPLARGLFHRAIAMSPAWQNAAQFHHPGAVVAESLAKTCLENSGCDSADCLKAQNYSEIRRDCPEFFDQRKFVSVTGAYFTGFDGEVLEESAYQKYCSGRPVTNAQVPLMVGALPHEWRLSEAGQHESPPAGPTTNSSIHKFFAEYIPGYLAGSGDLQQCVRDVALAHYVDASALSTCPVCQLFEGIEREVALAGDIEVSIGAQLAASASGGPRYRYVFDIEGDGSPLGSAHAGDVNYFNKAPGVVDHSPADDPTWEEKRELGMMFREYFFTFARHGVPSSSLGPAWEPVDPAQGALAFPLLHIRLGNGSTAMASEPWFNNGSAAFLSAIVCGHMGLSDFPDCAPVDRPALPVAAKIVVVAAAVMLTVCFAAFVLARLQKRRMTRCCCWRRATRGPGALLEEDHTLSLQPVPPPTPAPPPAPGPAPAVPAPAPTLTVEPTSATHTRPRCTKATIIVQSLNATHGDRKMDPFVELRYGTGGARTQVKRNGGREASWDEALGPIPLIAGEELHCSVKDFDTHKQHELVGETRPFVLDSVPRNAEDSWEDACDLLHEGQSRGQLFIKVQFLP